MINPAFRRTVILTLIVSLSLTSVACGGSSQSQPPRNNQAPQEQTKSQRSLPDGKYEVQQASYDDVSGQYRLFLLNANPPVLERENIKMARLTPEEIEQGQNSYLLVENGEYSLHLDEDFRIEYIHGVSETRTDPETGQEQRVVVRRESSFWAPFAGAIAGQALGNMLFRPQYYVPPPYQPGNSVMTGYGGYGSSYSQAVDRYQDRYQSPPASVQNQRAQVRTSGNLNRSSDRRSRSTTTGKSRSTGSGVGSNTLRQNDNNRDSVNRRSGKRSFGSSSGSRRSSGGRRRRR